MSGHLFYFSAFKMTFVKNISQLVRWPNLVIVFLAQYLFVYCLIQPFQPVFTQKVFSLVAFACVLTAASGNIINDFYDRDIDAVNKPDKVYIGKSISPRSAILLYFLFNIVAVILGLYADFLQHSVYAISFVLGSILLLWAYSRFFKKMYLIGNLIVAFLTTAPMVLLMLLEIEDFGKGQQYPILILFLFFSFWTSLIREILKDCEDVEGDALAHAKTLPIVSGITNAQTLALTFTYLMIMVLSVLLVTLVRIDMILLAAYVLLLVVLFGLLASSIKKAQQPEQFHKASSLVKIIMLVGTLSMLLIRQLVHFV